MFTILKSIQDYMYYKVYLTAMAVLSLCSNGFMKDFITPRSKLSPQNTQKNDSLLYFYNFQ